MPQPGRPTLPPLGALIADDDGERVQCHVCGEFFVRLGLHGIRTHEMNPDSYREHYGLQRTLSLDSPAYQLRARARALKQGLGALGAANLAPLNAAGQPGRPKGLPERLGGRLAHRTATR